jgi:PTS system nitrogen regulatory IIA component
VGLAALLEPELVFPRLAGTDQPTVLRNLAEAIAGRGRVEDPEALYQKLAEREQLGSTGIGSGVAIPHCKMKGLDRALMAVGVTRESIDFGAVDGKPVRGFVVLISPQDAPAAHLQALAASSRWVKANRHVDKVLRADDAEEIYGLLQAEGE